MSNRLGARLRKLEKTVGSRMDEAKTAMEHQKLRNALVLVSTEVQRKEDADA
jgi:hypothetical protein